MSDQRIEIDDLLDDSYIAVKEVIENDDGSANVELVLGKKSLELLVQVGFVSIIKKWADSDQAIQN